MLDADLDLNLAQQMDDEVDIVMNADLDDQNDMWTERNLWGNVFFLRRNKKQLSIIKPLNFKFYACILHTG